MRPEPRKKASTQNKLKLLVWAARPAPHRRWSLQALSQVSLPDALVLGPGKGNRDQPNSTAPQKGASCTSGPLPFPQLYFSTPKEFHVCGQWNGRGRYQRSVSHLWKSQLPSSSPLPYSCTLLLSWITIATKIQGVHQCMFTASTLCAPFPRSLLIFMIPRAPSL